MLDPGWAWLLGPIQLTWAMETIVLVTDVPMLAPITIGIACLRFKNFRKWSTILFSVFCLK